MKKKERKDKENTRGARFLDPAGEVHVINTTSRLHLVKCWSWMYAFMVPAASLPTATGCYYSRSSDGWWRALWKPIISLSCRCAYEKICCPPTECWPWLKGAAAHCRGQICHVASKANIAVTCKHLPECRAKYRRYDITYYLMWSQQTCTRGKFQRNENVRLLGIGQARHSVSQVHVQTFQQTMTCLIPPHINVNRRTISSSEWSPQESLPAFELMWGGGIKVNHDQGQLSQIESGAYVLFVWGKKVSHLHGAVS